MALRRRLRIDMERLRVEGLREADDVLRREMVGADLVRFADREIVEIGERRR